MQPAIPSGQQSQPQAIHIHNRFLPDWLDSDTLRQLFLVTITTVCLFYLPQAIAAPSTLPSGSIGIPGTGAGDSWAKQFTSAIAWGIVLLMLAALGIGLAKSIITAFVLVNDARNSGEWGPAIQQIIVVILIIVFAFVLYGVANKYVLEPLEQLGNGS